MTLGAAAARRTAPPPGMRVVLDARPLQDPERAPVTAAYLGALVGAYDAAPLEGESFAFFLRSDLADPTADLDRLDVIGRRLLPPSARLRSAAQTVDPFLLRGASIGVAWHAEQGGAYGAVHHTVGAGPLPIASGLPVVVTLLDLAPWEIPGAFTSGLWTRFGQRLRAQQLRGAAAIIVGSDAVAAAARRVLHLRPDRIRVIRLAPRPGFDLRPADSVSPADDVGPADDGERDPREDDIARIGLVPGRYLVYSGRYDVRQDLATLFQALASLEGAGRPADLPAEAPWPPRVLLAGATPDDRASLAKAAARVGVGGMLAYAPPLSPARLAALLRTARGSLLPVVSEAAGLAALESIATGTPVIASAVGPLPEVVGSAGLLVEPRDVDRLAVALRTLWIDDGLHGRLVATARDRATSDRRTWADVAAETRRVYAEVGVRRAE